MKSILILLFCIPLLLGISCANNSKIKKQNQTEASLTKEEEKKLVALGQLWGFLKYHHPAVAEGKYNWDEELIKRIPEILESKNEEAWKTMLDKWLDSLPDIVGNSGKKLPDLEIKTRPDYGELFNTEYFLPQTIEKIKYILENAIVPSNHYVSVNKIGRISFDNELAYENILYPDLSYRLLALFRHWNIINYFFPYRDMCDQKWSEVLPQMLPEFVSAENQEEYFLACLKLETKIDDSHGFFATNNSVYRLKWGLLSPPFKVKFVEERLVVTQYIEGDTQVKETVFVGDVITAMNGEPIDSIVKRMIPYMPASNYAVKQRQISASILSTNSNAMTLTIDREGKVFDVLVSCYDRFQLYSNYNNTKSKEAGYQIIDNNIGYVLPSNCKIEAQEAGIKKVLDGTRGVIFDYRCYPSDYISIPFLKHLNQTAPDQSLISVANVSYPGYFFFANKNRSKKIEKKNNVYENKIVLIVNEETQSQAEDHVLGFQLAPNVTVIGSTTAGADGAIAPFSLPGGIVTYMTGIGVYYPDGSNLQRNGVKIDEIVKPTIAGIRSGRDELLERAKQIIEDVKSNGGQ